MSELNKKMMNTPDLNEERLETLKKLFPDLFTVEGKLNLHGYGNSNGNIEGTGEFQGNNIHLS